MDPSFLKKPENDAFEADPFNVSSFSVAARRPGQKAAQPAEAAAPSAANGRDPAEHRRGRREGAAVTRCSGKLLGLMGYLWPLMMDYNMSHMFPLGID